MSSKTIAIIGAGIVGVSSAIWLQRAGHKVILIDREGPAAGTSYGNGGVLASCGVVPVNAPGLLKSAPGMLMRPDSPLFVRWSYLPKLLPWLIGYMRRANKKDTRNTAKALTAILYDSLEQHQALAKGTGAEQWLKPSDYVFIYKDRAAFEKDAYGWSLRREMGYEWDELEGDALSKYEPIFQGTRNFGVRFANHGTITDPGKYVTKLAENMQNQGGELIIAQALDIETQNGSVNGVRTSSGLIKCDAVVLAAGVWSKSLAEKLGVKVPMESERGYHIELINPSVMPKSPMMLASGKFVITPMEGRIRCAGIVEFGGLETPESRAPFNLLKKQIHEAIPGLTYDSIEEWMGHRPAPSDSIPFIGEIKTAPGIYSAFGHHHIGLTGGPKTGRIIADLISGRKNNVDLAMYDVSRFTH
ncbi:MAG: FAD-dependent oxidoreductase [Hyphomicrobiales bacterium]|nr:FAD-dependent oxidoreductase [Hyphomicrobiales bacterium]